MNINTFALRFAVATAATIGTAAGVAQAEPVRYEIEPTHTFVTFEVVHFETSTLRGRFDKVDGHVELDRKQGQGKADISIDLASINSGTPDFDAHLKSPDFFDAAKAPTARFVGNKFQFDGDKPTAVSGDLTLLGKTMPVTLKGTRFNCYDQPVLKVHVCGGDFETTIERSQWGMNWGIDMGIPDKVHLVVQIEAIRK